MHGCWASYGLFVGTCRPAAPLHVVLACIAVGHLQFISPVKPMSIQRISVSVLRTIDSPTQLTNLQFGPLAS